MKAWDYRFLLAISWPFALAVACDPGTVTPPDDDTDSTTTTTTTTSTAPTPTTVTPTTVDPTTTTVDPDSSSGGDESTTTTTAADTSTTGPVSVCGNNILEGDEACDLNQLNGETCASLGYQGGVLGCLLTCEDYNLLGCFICGNEVIDIAEDCEGGVVPEEVTCESLGFEAGWVTCGDDCLYDLAECSICGDGIQAGPELCDGIDFGGEDCMSLGFDGGNLGCNLAECQFVYSGCIGGQYIQNFEGAATMPLEFTTPVGTTAWVVDDMNAIDGARSARAGALPAGGISDVELMADFVAAGNIEFDHETSCANGVDFLEFYVDDILQGSWTGITALANFSMPIAAGNHTFRWRFNRAGFINKGMDTVWFDNLILDGGIPL